MTPLPARSSSGQRCAALTRTRRARCPSFTALETDLAVADRFTQADETMLVWCYTSVDAFDRTETGTLVVTGVDGDIVTSDWSLEVGGEGHEGTATLRLTLPPPPALFAPKEPWRRAEHRGVSRHDLVSSSLLGHPPPRHPDSPGHDDSGTR